jgi:hypothetical protein
MLRLTRLLMWVHFLYLLALPTLAVVGWMVAGGRDVGNRFWFFIGPAAAYIMSVAACYAVPASLRRTLLLVVAVPAQILLGRILFGGTAWHFFLEAGAVEVGALCCALTYVMLRHRPSGFWGAGVGVLLLGGPSLVLLGSLLFAEGFGRPWGGVLLLTAFATAFVEHAALFGPAARRYLDTALPQTVVLEYGGGPWDKFLGRARESLSPDVSQMVVFAVFFGAFIIVPMLYVAASAILR